MAATALLPLAIPPVRPMRSMRVSAGTGDVRSGSRLRAGTAEASSFHGIAHEHGDGHRANAAGNGREGACDFDGIGMHVSDERGAFSTKFFEPGREVTEEARGFVGIANAIGADV